MRLLLASMVALSVVQSFAQGPVSGVWPRVMPTTFVDLSYPADALAARVTGRVVVRADADTSGRVISAEVLAGPDRLAPAVRANVLQWTLLPGVRSMVIVYRFVIDPADCNDDSRSLFRLAQPNLVVITACTGPGRALIPFPIDDLELVSSGKPVYPTLAFRARIMGVIVLELSLDAKGTVVDAQALTEIPFLTAAAVLHAKTWRFRPTERRRGIVVYEFAQDKRWCNPDLEIDFWRVTAGYMRLSACGPVVGGGE